MSHRLLGLSHRVGYAAFLSLASGVAAFLPTQGYSLQSLWRFLTYLDIPVSAVGRLLPEAFRGVWLFWPDPDVLCRSVGPDAGRLLLNQVLIGTPTYVGLLYLPQLAYALLHLVRRRRARATQEPAP
jgi:hypothetical protein